MGKKVLRKIFCWETALFLIGLTLLMLHEFTPIMSVDAGKDVEAMETEEEETGNDEGYFVYSPREPETNLGYSTQLPEIPEYSGKPYYVIGDADFGEQNAEEIAFELYCDLDELGRAGWALCCLGPETMPAVGETRGSIGMIKPTGWSQNKYESIADAWNPAGYVLNRAHICGWQLGGNDIDLNLFTGTRYLNVEGMLPFENMVADYIRKTGNHVLYMVTPIFEGDNLLASGVRMEALSIEDDGKGICFDVYCYNVQPGIVFDYATGENWEE